MRGATAQYKCQRCQQPFTARTADRNRGWARFCSKSCKAIRQTQQRGPRLPPNVSFEQYRADAREYGGAPQYDRHGRYVGFTMSQSEMAGGGYGDAEWNTPFGEGKD